MRVATFSCITIISLVAGCTQFPDIDNAISSQAKNAPYPTLIPLTPSLLSQPATKAKSAEKIQKSLNARLAAMHRRANALRQMDIAAPLKKRLR